MADILIDNQTAPTTPAGSKSVIWVDSTTKRLMQTDDSGSARGILSRNFSTASTSTGFATDTYVPNSNLAISTFGIQAGYIFEWVLVGSKTGAGTATPTFIFRYGTGVIGDTALLTLTGVAQTGVIDNGVFRLRLWVRTAGASGVVVGSLALTHTSAAAVGFGSNEIDGVSGTVNLTGQTTMGLSINGGASAVWTFTAVDAMLIG